MEHYSSAELRAIITYENGQATLNLNEKELTKVPDAVTELTELEVLRLSGNNLTELPKSINKLKNLKRLNLDNNKLSYLPAEIGELKELRMLDVNDNHLAVVPDAVTELIELEVLRLSRNNLTELSKSINKLKNLKRLNLDNNKLSYLPAEIGELKELRMLGLNDNQLAVVHPTGMQKLRKLQKLHLYNNSLSELPSVIGELKELRRLWVSQNQLAEVPTSLLKLQELQELYLDNNKLSFLPAEIGDLKELTLLYVSGNPFTVDAMRSLLKLKEEKKGKIDIDITVPAEIESRGERAQLAYQRALDDGAVNAYRGRILLIGQDRAGKTSLKKSLIGLPFDPKEQSTEGIEVDPSSFQVDVNQVKNWQSVDENERGLLGCSKEVARIVVEKLQNDSGDDSDDYSTSDDSSDGYNDDYYSDDNSDGYSDDEEEEDDSYIHVGEQSIDEQLINNATSLPDDITNHVNQLIRSLRPELTESDIKQEESIYDVDLWDFAGQHLYYASHSIFFSLRAIYVLVYNLSKSLSAIAQPCVRQGIHEVLLENSNGETNMENLLSWLVTVHTITRMRRESVQSAQGSPPYLCPPVIIVGTHADKPFENIASMKSQIQKRISRKEYKRHVVRPIFSIDNTAGSQPKKGGSGQSKAPQAGNIDKIQALQDKIMEVLRQEPYMGEKIPVRWINFEKIVSALAAKNTHHIDIKELQTYAEHVCFIVDEEEFETMVNFYHDLGIIIKHRSTVVLNSQWLIDLFRQLITIPHFDKMDPIVSHHWDEVQESGVLSMELVDHVFAKFLLQGFVKDDILNMMEQFGLIAKFSPSTTDVKYFVPAQLKASPDSICAMKPSSSDPCPLYVYFCSGFVPHGLFTRLVSHLIRWCSKAGPTQPPTLYQNGAWFVIGRQVVHDFILTCKKQFIKVVLKQRSQSQQVLGDKSTDHEVAVQVREFVDGTLQSLSRDLPYLHGLQYKFHVECPYCDLEKCTNHGDVSCAHEDCLHLLEISQGNPLICKKKLHSEVLRVDGLEKWFTQRTSQELHRSGRFSETLKVVLLANEWESSKGGLSTINRTLAIHLAKHAEVDVTLLVPQFTCSEGDKRAAKNHNISVREAQRRPGFSDPLDWLSFPPKDLTIHIVIGHGAKLGKQAQVIREYHHCQWVQVVHTEPEELAMHKNYPRAIAKGEEKNRAEVDLCKLANLVVAVGPKLAEAYSSYLRSSYYDIFELTPGTFSDVADVKHSAQETGKFKVLTFGRGDSEDLNLKGYDIAARAIVELKDSSYCLLFVGASDGKQDEFAEVLLSKTGISRNQLTVRSFVENRERLKELFSEVDVAIMPSRTEGFGLTALEAMSSGLPILVSGNSGFGKSLRRCPEGKSFVIESEDPKVWAKSIAALRQKSRTQLLQDIQTLRKSYDDMYSWEGRCQSLLDRMWNMVYGVENSTKHKSPVKSGTGDDAARQTVNDTDFRQDVEFLRAPEYRAPVNSCEEDAASGHMNHVERISIVLQQMKRAASKATRKTDLPPELTKIASQKGFIISDNQGGGNCMFYALSEQLDLVKGIQISHKDLRHKVVNYLKKNPTLPDGTELFNFVDGYSSWDAYLTNMAADGTWGDHVILYGAANCFGTCLYVISTLSDDLIIRPERDVDSSKQLALGHVHELHYVSLHPLKQVKEEHQCDDELEELAERLATLHLEDPGALPKN